MAFSQKGALKEGRTIVFCDQSGFYLLPMVVRTYAPVGKTPVLREHLSRDHLSATMRSATMSAITLEGKLYMIEQERAFNQGRGRGALSQAPDAPDRGQEALALYLGWLSDSPLSGGQGLPRERGALANTTGAVARLYAPDLNPDEGVWKHHKCVELKNLCCQSLLELRVELRKAKERLRHKKHVILGCIKQPGFEV
jgi:transposase